MVFKKMMRKYRNGSSKSNVVSDKSNSKSIFRSKAASVLTHETGLTETFSGDSADSDVSSFSCAQSTISASSHKFSGAARDAEVMQLKHSIKELEEHYRDELAELQACMCRTTDEACDLRMHLQKVQDELEATKTCMEERDMEYIKTKAELLSTKEQLKSVSTVLLQTQDALHKKEEDLTTMRQLVDFGKGIAGFFTI